MAAVNSKLVVRGEATKLSCAAIEVRRTVADDKARIIATAP
jgi:hypothetical protein